MKGDGYRFEHGRFRERKILWQAIKDSRWNGDVFGKSSRAAKLSAGNSQDLTVIAKIYIATEAMGARAAENGRIKGDSIALGESSYLFAERGNGSRSFMSHHNWWNTAARRAIVAVNIAATDAAGGHADQDFAVTRIGIGKVGNFQVLVLRKQKSSHE